jgi:hypothetical protein
MQSEDITSDELYKQDAKNTRRLQLIVDFTRSLLYQTNEGIEHDFQLVETVRRNSVALFPDMEKTFFLIYYPRLRRILVEKYGSEAEFYAHPLNTKFEEYFGGVTNEHIQ